MLREYNPQLLRDRVPPIGGDYLVALPESRVQRALAAFPAYSDQEIIAQNDETSDPGEPVAPAVDGFVIDPDADDPLPSRPASLGRNRLPAMSLPGRERMLMNPASLGVAFLDAKLPASLTRPDVGWRWTYLEDPLGLMAGADRSSAVLAKAGDTALGKQLGFLHEAAPVEALRSFTLPSGIIVRVRRDRARRTPPSPCASPPSSTPTASSRASAGAAPSSDSARRCTPSPSIAATPTPPSSSPPRASASRSATPAPPSSPRSRSRRLGAPQALAEEPPTARRGLPSARPSFRPATRSPAR